MKNHLPRRLPFALPVAWSRNPFLGPSRVTTARTPEVTQVNVHGRLGANSGEALQEATTVSIVNGLDMGPVMGLVMVVHLQTVKQANAAGFGPLLVAGGV